MYVLVCLYQESGRKFEKYLGINIHYSNTVEQIALSMNSRPKLIHINPYTHTVYIRDEYQPFKSINSHRTQRHFNRKMWRRHSFTVWSKNGRSESECEREMCGKEQLPAHHLNSELNFCFRSLHGVYFSQKFSFTWKIISLLLISRWWPWILWNIISLFCIRAFPVLIIITIVQTEHNHSRIAHLNNAAIYDSYQCFALIFQ